MYSEILLVACTSCLIKFLALMLGALALGLLAGWLLWGKYKTMVDGLNSEIKGLKNKLNEREKDFASLKYAHDELEKDNGGMRSSLAGCEGDRAALQASLNRKKKELAAAALVAAAAAGGSLSAGIVDETVVVDKDNNGIDAGAVLDTEKSTKMGSGITDTVGVTGSGTNQLGFASYGNYFDKDNLQIIEGIGPKISRTLQSAGINNWEELSGKSASELEAVLTAASINIKINNPKTWPEQARLANEGEWEELIKYQKLLDTGMDSKGDFETPAKVEKLYLKAIGFAGAKADNLKIIEGVGPKIEGLLKDGGINNWSELAKAEVATIQGILDAAGPRYKLAKPGTWPTQAGLAAAGKWSELKAYQDSLNGGK
jgi:predicted flap endonuclease-1-like 5' DNA nuclease